MTSQEITVYREIQRNTEMAMKAIDTIADKIEDKNLAIAVSEQSLQYSKLHNEAVKQLIDARIQPYQGSYFADAMLKTGIHYNTMLNVSTSHIAELMIKGSNNGILEMEKVLKSNEAADKKATSLAQQLIASEENHVKQLKQYL